MSSREAHVVLKVDTTALVASLNRAATAYRGNGLLAALDRATRVTAKMDAQMRDLRKRVDHDRHSPRPLCIDGHAYRRRRQARRRRR